MNPLPVSLAAAGVAALFLHVLAPGVSLRLALLPYPKNHSRRLELVAELYHVPIWKRPSWVAGILVHCISEGISERVSLIRAARTTRLDRITRREMRLIRKYSQWVFVIIRNDELVVVKKYDPVMWERLLSPDSLHLIHAG